MLEPKKGSNSQELKHPTSPTVEKGSKPPGTTSSWQRSTTLSEDDSKQPTVIGLTNWSLGTPGRQHGQLDSQ